MRIFIALKSPLPWPGSNSRPLPPVASTLITIPPRRFYRENRITQKNLPSATLQITNSKWTERGANLGLRGERPATNLLSRRTANSQLFYKISFEQYTPNYFKCCGRYVYCRKVLVGWFIIRQNHCYVLCRRCRS
jgi:hypothetical protein